MLPRIAQLALVLLVAVQIRSQGQHTHIILDHHRMTPAFVWIKGDTEQPVLYTIRSQVDRPGLRKTSYVVQYVNRPFTLHVIYTAGVWRTLAINADRTYQDRYDPPLPASWASIKNRLRPKPKAVNDTLSGTIY